MLFIGATVKVLQKKHGHYQVDYKFSREHLLEFPRASNGAVVECIQIWIFEELQCVENASIVINFVIHI